MIGNVLRIALAIGLFLTFQAHSQAGTITYTNTKATNTGTGFGTIDNVLTVQNNPSEYGAVSWNGTKDATTGNATNTSQTLTAAYLTSAAGTNITWNAVTGANFRIIFQVNQSGTSTLDLNKFQLDFFKADGTSALASVVYTNGVPSSTTLGGVGVGTSGYVFNVQLTGAEASAFFGTGTNRLGMSVPSASPINNTSNDGPENFYIAAGQSVAVPEPATLTLVGMALLGSAGYGWRRRKTA